MTDEEAEVGEREVELGESEMCQVDMKSSAIRQYYSMLKSLKEVNP